MPKSDSRSSKSLRIILLDHSGSMSNPFAASAELAGHAKTGDYETKMEAAKDVTLSELAQFGQLFNETHEVDVAVIAFTSQSRLLFKCPANQFQYHSQEIMQLTPTNGTSIGGALNFAHENISTWDSVENYKYIHILMVSDGLSNIVEAQEAAKRLDENGISINVMLIDPSPDGINLVKVILEFGGNVTPVHSKAELKSVIRKESKSLEREIKAQPSLAQTLAALIPLILAIVTIISLSFGVFSQITPERKIFQSSILFGVPMILFGGYFLYHWYERIGEQELFINRHEKKNVPIFKRTDKQRKKFLIIGIIVILIGIIIIVIGSIYAPDSPFTSTPTPTITPTVTFTPLPTNTTTSTTTPNPTASRTMTPTKTLTQTATP